MGESWGSNNRQGNETIQDQPTSESLSLHSYQGILEWVQYHKNATLFLFPTLLVRGLLKAEPALWIPMQVTHWGGIARRGVKEARWGRGMKLRKVVLTEVCLKPSLWGSVVHRLYHGIKPALMSYLLYSWICHWPPSIWGWWDTWCNLGEEASILVKAVLQSRRLWWAMKSRPSQQSVCRDLVKGIWVGHKRHPVYVLSFKIYLVWDSSPAIMICSFPGHSWTTDSSTVTGFGWYE